MTHQLGDAPIQEQYRELMQLTAQSINYIFNGNKPRKTGFVLLVFPFGQESGGRCNFISNGAQRKDVIALFKEMIARFEGQPETKGHA